ncbi:hypothetical protein KIN20_023798 [Parelaphostrongylus tenuis]|uniref:Uncharacterized protein n=1 Tax=Parelaphostrongylus tenuis TaxID=148309 RepID=A0AAD5QW10_PARTN|nr:hypothetical protein KIN20_023798 [Parelaphostrongylus tenuis]
MQTILDVLENQGRSALLPDAVISAILNQLTVRISYEPLQCQKVLDGIMDNVVDRGFTLLMLYSKEREGRSEIWVRIS